ncbi:eukaryotic translation initiation factor 3 subunit H-like [Zophobas morio]|uniref:eukaryotic translation initiation factor 3 subunit H-like n=1 Tax=Zophobas morio TaxID=2755281 RepID=UPI0030838179
MMSRLKEINIDNNAIGWYQSTYLGFLNGMMINAQYNYQSSISQSVMLVYDPYRSQQGIISLRAFRLSKKFMDSFKANNSELIMITPAIIKNHGLTHEDIFQELPIEITNSPLARSLLAELETPRHKPDIFNKLNLAFHTFTEKNLELLIDGTEILTQDQNKYQYYLRHVARQQQAQEDLSRLREENERRTAEGLPPLNLSESLVNATRPVIAPNRLDALLTYNQISNFCLQVDNFAANTFTKLYLLQSLQKSSTIIFNE